MAYGTVQADVIGTSVAGSNLGAGNASIMKNRIINGAMVIAQRSTASVSVQTSAQYVAIDRWGVYNTQNSKCTVQQNAGSVTPPAGFTNYQGITSSSAYSSLSSDIFTTYQVIEGYNIADLGWGTANAKTVTLSFWVYSSLTGTFGGALQNGGSNRSYPFTYTVSSANTWEQKSITIAGDTTGTWNSTNGAGIQLFFDIGVGSTYKGTTGSWSGSLYFGATGATSVVGTNGATFYITGVQLEVGSSATGFEYRQYGQELALCQRYYNNYGVATTTWFISSTVAYGAATFPPMRTAPTVVGVSGTQQYGPGGQLSATVAGYGSTGTTYTGLSFTQSGGGTTNAGGLAWGNITLSSEL